MAMVEVEGDWALSSLTDGLNLGYRGFNFVDYNKIPKVCSTAIFSLTTLVLDPIRLAAEVSLLYPVILFWTCRWVHLTGRWKPEAGMLVCWSLT